MVSFVAIDTHLKHPEPFQGFEICILKIVVMTRKEISAIWKEKMHFKNIIIFNLFALI